MVDRLDDLSPTEPFIRLALLGASMWNNWLCTVLSKDDVRRLDLDRKAAQLSKSELEDLASAARLDRLPLLTRNGANFSDVDFRSVMPSLSFSNFVFPQGTSFEGATFGGLDVDAGAVGHAQFADAIFDDSASFRRACFGNASNFSGAIFGFAIDFTEARFGDDTNFSRCGFGPACRFASAKFGHRTNFAGAYFQNDADFSHSVIGGWPILNVDLPMAFSDFSETVFGGQAVFSHCQLNDRVSFANCTFRSRLMFDHANFAQGCNLSGVEKVQRPPDHGSGPDTPQGQLARDRVLNADSSKFFGYVSFESAVCVGVVNLERRCPVSLYLTNAVFYQPPILPAADDIHTIHVIGMKIYFGSRRKTLRRFWTNDINTVASIRRLRKTMADLHAHDIERELFILERQAERGILWSRDDGQSRLAAISLTLLLFGYGTISGFGRSVLRPSIWLAATTGVFHFLYLILTDKSIRSAFDADLVSFTLGSALPFASGLNPARKDVLTRLFSHFDPLFGWTIKVPLLVEILSMLQSLLGAAFLFFLLLAVRNRFKIN